MGDGVLRWEEPPAEHGNARPKKPSKYQPMADALRSRPGQWAVVAERRTTGSAGSLSHHIRYGTNPWTPAGAFEAKTVGPAGGLGKVYARYVGEVTEGRRVMVRCHCDGRYDGCNHSARCGAAGGGDGSRSPYFCAGCDPRRIAAISASLNDIAAQFRRVPKGGTDG